MRRERLELDAAPDAVPRARRFVVDLLDAWSCAAVADDASLAVTELVTNALLHAGPPVAVVVELGSTLRVAVHDPSTAPPLRARPGPETMTGRGLALVSALTDGWGVERTERGKAVWFEFGVGARPAPAGEPVADPGEIDSILAGWDDLAPASAQRVYEVSLGDVPTELLLQAKTHVDNVVRELTLVRAGAAVGARRLPAHLAALVEDVVTGFAEARNAIKRQALRAAGRGEERVRLHLTLPATAAEAGERYLAALDEADSYARAARLLTLEAPPQHRAFRHWYVESLIAQLRGKANGSGAPPTPTFEQFLLGEVDTIAAAHRAADRGARLQHVAAALSAAATPSGVADVVVDAAVAVLGARAGALILLTGEAESLVAGQVGYAVDVLDRIRSAAVPGWSTHTGEPVWVESREERDALYPGLAALEPATASLCVVPLVIGGRNQGVLRLSFAEPRLFDSDERDFVLALAALSAQAVERADLYQTQAQLADRLARLQQVTTVLAVTQRVTEVTRVVITHTSAVLQAELAAFCLVSADGQELRVEALESSYPGAALGFERFAVDADLPAAESFRTGRPLVLTAPEERDRRYPGLVGVGPAHERTLICLPLTVQDRRLGVLNLALTGIRPVPADELEFLTSLAEVSAQSLDRALALEEAQEATEKLAFLADASAELAGSLDYPRTLARVAELAVPRLGDWCSVQILETGSAGGSRLVPLAVAHADPAQVELARYLQARYPARPEDLSGSAHVVRTGKSELYPMVTDETLAGAARDPEHLALLRRLGIASMLIVPLAARDRTFGALSLARTSGAQPFDHEDLALAEDLARLAALAIDNARLYSRDRPAR